MSLLKPLATTCSAFAVLGVIGSATAGNILNGNFATGDLSDWTRSAFNGQNQARDDANHTTADYLLNRMAGVPAADSNFVAAMQTTTFDGFGPAVSPAIAAPAGAGFFADLSNETSAGSETLTGSQISQTLTATGSAITFTAQFLSNERIDAQWDYGGVALLDGSGGVLAEWTADHDPTSATSPTTVHALANAAGGFFDSTGWVSGSFSLAGLDGRTLTLLAYVENTGDTAVESRLLLTNVAETGSAPVPEPASLALLGTALAGLAPFRRRLRRNSPAAPLR